MFGRREFLAGPAALGLAEKAGAGVLSSGAADRAVDAFLKTQPFQGDLLKAAHAVLDGPFLSPASKKQLLSVGWPDQDYALGGRVKSLFGTV